MRRLIRPGLSKGFRMITDTEIKTKGIQVLAQYLGDVEAERFIALIQREPFDYTKWRGTLNEKLSVEEISRRAMLLRNNEENDIAVSK
jgi:hypothetical protein